MKQKRWKPVIFVFSSFFMLQSIYPSVAKAESANFSIQAIIPENQVDKKQTYFDLRMEPEQQQRIQLVIDNSNSEDILAYIAINAATTGRNGLIVYNDPEAADESLTVSIQDIATVVKDEVRVPALGSATVDIDLQMPKEAFDGVILGGITATAEVVRDAEQAQEEQEGIYLENEYVYVIGLKITQNDEPVEPDFHLRSITPTLINYRTAVVLNIQNNKPVIVKEIDLSANIYKEGSSDILHSLVLENVEMAPQSNGDFVIDWERQPLQAGAYRLKMELEHDGKNWEWDETFVIQSDEAKEQNDNAVDLQKSSMPYYIIGGIILGVLAFYLGRRTKK